MNIPTLSYFPLIICQELSVKLSLRLYFKPPLGTNYMRLDTRREGHHDFPITRSWKEVTNGVDAVFSYSDNMYLIKVGLTVTTKRQFICVCVEMNTPCSPKRTQDDQVYIYNAAAQYILIEGYPKTLKEELGIEGHVDAAFVCPNDDTVYIIIGKVATGLSNSCLG